jgi:hypothetical protein
MGRISFIAPFESTTYTAALERDMFVNLPLRASVNLDIENNQVEAALKPLNSNQYQKLLQWTTLPYTTKQEILSIKPANEESSTKVIRSLPSKSVSHNILRQQW